LDLGSVPGSSLRSSSSAGNGIVSPLRALRFGEVEHDAADAVLEKRHVEVDPQTQVMTGQF
jgi:hypothetical protein